jgi:hypothetical protein
MSEGGLYELQSARDLFKKAQRDITEFFDAPSDYALFNLLCTLTHLRDWVCPGGHGSYEGREASLLTREEGFHRKLHHDPDYKLVRELCNNAKHFNDRSGVGTSARIFHGFFVGLNYAGDYLGHRNYTVEGRDLREPVGRLMKLYHDFFAQGSDGELDEKSHAREAGKGLP